MECQKKQSVGNDTILQRGYHHEKSICSHFDHRGSSIEDADYIIRCHTEYNGGIGSGGARLHFPETHITLHDVHDGTLLCDLGTEKRTVSGQIALYKGDTWWEPLRTKLWEKIKVLFVEG